MNNQNEKEKLANLERRIKIDFKNIALLKNAMIHRSYLNENKDETLSNNEKLEFLGDAVLELLVTEFLFNEYPDRSEGELTSFRAALVRTESLAETADSIDLGEYIYMSKGEEATGGRKRPYILANCFEALLGAIYMDQGIKPCERFILENLVPKVKVIVEKRLDIDSKSKLQEIAQEIVGFTPVYELIGEDGPDHNKTFEMGVKIGDHLFATGKGRNKQEAEQHAANAALNDWDVLLKKYFPERAK